MDKFMSLSTDIGILMLTLIDIYRRLKFPVWSESGCNGDLNLWLDNAENKFKVLFSILQIIYALKRVF